MFKRIVSLVAVGVLACGVSAFAAEGGEKKAKPAAPTTRATAAKALNGQVAAVNLEAQTITVSTKKGDVDVKVDANTKYMIDEQAGQSLADLKKGMKVHVEPDSGVATKITATSVKPAKAAGEKATKEGKEGKHEGAAH